MGLNMGSVLGIGVLLTILTNLDFGISFPILGGMIVVIAIGTPFMVIEPLDLKEKKAEKKRLKQIKKQRDKGKHQ